MRRLLPGFLLWPGVALLAATAGITLLSGQFVFGENHTARPIPEFMWLTGISFAAYFWAFECLGRSSPEAPGRLRRLFWILLIASVCRLLYFPSNLIQETDPYRYVWDGQTVLRGANPYTLSPQEASATVLRKAGEEAWARETYERINYPAVKTIYPPLAQGFFALSQSMSPWHLWGWRLLILMAECMIIGCLCLILASLHKPPEWVLIYAWSPLVLKEFSNSLHLDVFAVLFLCVMMAGILKGRHLTAFICLALAVLVKWFALFLAPLLFVWTWRTCRRTAIAGIVVLGGVILCAYLPFLNAGMSLFEGLVRFAGEWRVNAGLFDLIHTGTVFVFSSSTHQVNQISRMIALGCLAGVIGVLCARLVRADHVVSFGSACAAALAALFLLAPAANPWYFTWTVPFLFFLPLRSLALLSGLVMLYYFDFYFMYRLTPERFFWVRFAEYGIFFLCLGWEWRTKNRRSGSFYRF